jgi:hypothetical protein
MPRLDGAMEAVSELYAQAGGKGDIIADFCFVSVEFHVIDPEILDPEVNLGGCGELVAQAGEALGGEGCAVAGEAPDTGLDERDTGADAVVIAELVGREGFGAVVDRQGQQLSLRVGNPFAGVAQLQLRLVGERVAGLEVVADPPGDVFLLGVNEVAGIGPDDESPGGDRQASCDECE